MKRESLSFGVAGVIFGFLLGFVVAHEMYGGRFAGMPFGAVTPGAPAGQPSSGSMAAPSAASGATPQVGSADTMEQVTLELNALKQALQEDPHDVKVLGRLGQLYMDAAMYEQAIQYYRQALAVQPGDAHLRTDMATSLLMMGNAVEALAELKDIVAGDPEHGKTWYWLGLAHVEAGEFEQGKAAFTKALELMPGSFDMEEISSEIEKVKARRAAESSGSSPS